MTLDDFVPLPWPEKLTAEELDDEAIMPFFAGAEAEDSDMGWTTAELAKAILEYIEERGKRR